MIDAHKVNTLLNASSIEELWGLHTQYMAEYGFDRLIYGYTRYRTATSLGNPDDFVILTNHSNEYTDVFIGEGLYFHAPMVRWALENDGACSWSRLTELNDSGAMTPEERKVYEFNRAQNLSAGYSISFKSLSPRTKGAIALTARPGLTQCEIDEMWGRLGEGILALNNLAHLRILSLPYTPPGRGLTPRQREVLAWVGDGKTVQDIALLVGLTPATVEKHLRLARAALNVETTAQAVLKAAFQNQIFILGK
ncbi:LuxR family transcriptional regulator [Roseovarius sp.]|uniref:LuxR family transcriptional regulator n=1 Tax=Roseovarius sp. TaxID=1486281 RepID=UPI002630109F|nr:LuxR family transcriptional regulator [Roseovarius sp.]